MADLAESPEVKDLATQIMDAQDAEIEAMTGWLTSWGQPVPDDMSGMDMSSSMPGTMSQDEMTSVENTSGAEFDQMFLAMLVEHDQGAIEMAKSEQSEQSDGMYPNAIAPAKQIETAQTDEITTMRALLWQAVRCRRAPFAAPYPRLRAGPAGTRVLAAVALGCGYCSSPCGCRRVVSRPGCEPWV